MQSAIKKKNAFCIQHLKPEGQCENMDSKVKTLHAFIFEIGTVKELRQSLGLDAAPCKDDELVISFGISCDMAETVAWHAERYSGVAVLRNLVLIDKSQAATYEADLTDMLDSATQLSSSPYGLLAAAPIEVLHQLHVF